MGPVLLVALALAAPARAGWDSLPVSFEPNRGQAPPSVDFITRSRDGAGFLAKGALTLRLDRAHAVRMRLWGAHPRKPEALEPLPGITSYFLGSDPSRWIAGIPTYGQVLYREAMPGVDLRYHGSERHLELDMVLAPTADPGHLRLAFDGADRVAVRPDGDLLLTAGGRSLTLRRPIAYQEIAGERRPVAAEYVVKGDRAVAIALGERDRARPVVVDPVVVYSAQIGGTGDDGLEAVAVDSSGAVYAAGYAQNGFPTVGGIQGYNGSTDAVVLKLDPSGSTLLYSVYLGGGFIDHAYGIAVDSAGEAVIAGETGSGFPVVSAVQSTYGSGPSDGFVAKLNAAGTGLVYSTYVGGSQADTASAVALDGPGNAYITGGTQSSNYVTTSNGYQRAKAGQRDAFVLELPPSGTPRLYSTFMGGQQEDYGQAIAVNEAGDVFVAGATSSSDFPLSNAFQTTNNGGLDAFVFKLTSGGTQLPFSTYLGGAGDDTAEGLVLHLATSGVVIAGGTLSANFPTTSGSYDPFSNPGYDAYVSEFAADGGLTFSTFLGGSGNDTAQAVALGPTGGLWVAGHTTSTDFPTTGSPSQGNAAGSGDAFVAQLDGSGSSLIHATYLGGTGDDWGLGIAVDGAGGIYVVGQTGAAFPTTPGAFQSPGAGVDAFAVKLREPFSLSALNPSSGPTGGGTQVTITGAGFGPDLHATFGGADASVTTYADPTTLVARTPPHAEGQVDVQVIALDGTKRTLSGAFTYVTGPAVDGGDDGGVPDGGGTDGGGPGRPVDLLGCSCASGTSGSTALAFVLLAAIAARARQRRTPTSAPPSQ